MSRVARIRYWVHGAYKLAKTTVIGGLVFVVPLFVFVWLASKALKLLRRAAEPLAVLLPLDRVIGVLAADALLVAALIVVCFMGGLLARVSSAYRFVKRAESGVLWRIPGYGFIRLADGRRVVYIPSSADPRAGSVMVMDADRVEPVPLTFVAALRDLRALGRGLGTSIPGTANGE